MIPAMTSMASAWGVLVEWGRATLQWFAGWRRIVMFSAKLLVLALSPSTYRGAIAERLRRRMELFHETQ